MAESVYMTVYLLFNQLTREATVAGDRGSGSTQSKLVFRIPRREVGQMDPQRESFGY